MVEKFIVVRSAGGPYDDEAFVAGATWGHIASLLHWCEHMGVCPPSVYVQPALVAQVDLTTMRHGFVARYTPWADHPDDWVLVEWSGPVGG